MLRAIKQKMPHWLAGTATAFAGVALVRLVAPRLGEKSAALLGATGHLLALAGLVMIAFGVRQRVWAKNMKTENAENESPQPGHDQPARAGCQDKASRPD